MIASIIDRLKGGTGAYYIRVSTDQQDTERQQVAIERWMSDHELTIPDQFRFMDEGFVRDLPSLRPEFQRMMTAADTGLVNWIVADRQDRFGTKDKYQFISFMHRLRESNCMFLTVDGKCWTDDSMVAFLEGAWCGNERKGAEGQKLASDSSSDPEGSAWGMVWWSHCLWDGRWVLRL